MTQGIDVRLLRAAIILAGELSYTRAANKLDITPLELERRINVLEGLLEVKIFVSSHEKVQVTDEGLIFITRCRTFLAMI